MSTQTAAAATPIRAGAAGRSAGAEDRFASGRVNNRLILCILSHLCWQRIQAGIGHALVYPGG